VFCFPLLKIFLQQGYGIVTVTVCEPHDEEKVTLPLVFLTVMVNDVELAPLTVAELGET
jgi:hypothetical protein